MSKNERPRAGDIILKPVIFRSGKPAILPISATQGKKGDLVYRAIKGTSNGFHSNNFVLLEDQAGKGIVLFIDKESDDKEWYALEVLFANKDFGRARIFDPVTEEKLITYYEFIKESPDSDKKIEDFSL